MNHPATGDIERIDERCFSVTERSDIVEQLQQPFARVWAALVHADPQNTDCRPCWAGYLVAWHIVDELQILNVATAPEFRRRGTASALVRRLLDYAKKNNVRVVLLEVRRSNSAAIRLYDRFGFKVFSERKNYYENNGEDALEMMATI